MAEVLDLVQPGAELGGRYLLTEVCGQGRCGVVFRGHDKEMGTEVAVKVLHPSVGADAMIGDRFRDTLSQLRESHPGVAKVLGGGTHGNLVFMVREWVAGESLEQIMVREGEMAAARVSELIAQLVRVVGFTHMHGVVHQDLKPGHVLVMPGDRCKIIDFGLAARLDGEIQRAFPGAANLVGTPGYLAPELLSGEAATPSVDIYAIGLMAYRMLTGTPAYQGDTQLATVSAQVGGAPEQPELGVVVLPIWRTLERMMERNPLARYHDAAAVLEDIEESESTAPEAGETLAMSLDNLMAGGLLSLPVAAKPAEVEAPAPAAVAPAAVAPPVAAAPAKAPVSAPPKPGLALSDFIFDGADASAAEKAGSAPVSLLDDDPLSGLDLPSVDAAARAATAPAPAPAAAKAAPSLNELLPSVATGALPPPRQSAFSQPDLMPQPIPIAASGSRTTLWLLVIGGTLSLLTLVVGLLLWLL